MKHQIRGLSTSNISKIIYFHLNHEISEIIFYLLLYPKFYIPIGIVFNHLCEHLYMNIYFHPMKPNWKF
jgi:hypothetical protein